MQQSIFPEYTLVSETGISKEVEEILVEGERFITAYRTMRDSVTFTTKRIIFRDSQGLSGKKVEVYSLPHSSILMWSSENAKGIFDINAELELWTKVGLIKIKIGKNVDIRALDRLISQSVLN